MCLFSFYFIDILISLRIFNNYSMSARSEGYFHRFSLEKEVDPLNHLRNPLQRNQEKNHLKRMLSVRARHQARNWTRPRNVKNLKQRKRHHLQKVLRNAHLLYQRRSCLRLPSHRQGECILKESLPHGGPSLFLLRSLSLRLQDGG